MMILCIFVQNSHRLPKKSKMHCKLSLTVLKMGKSVNWPYLVIQAKNEKIQGTFFSRTLKVEEKKVVLFH